MVYQSPQTGLPIPSKWGPIPSNSGTNPLKLEYQSPQNRVLIP